MASLELINDKCSEKECAARATTMIRDKTGSPVTLTCTKHARAALIRQSEKENGREARS